MTKYDTVGASAFIREWVSFGLHHDVVDRVKFLFI